MEMENVCLGRLVLKLPKVREIVSASGRIDDVLVEVIPNDEEQPLNYLIDQETQRLTTAAKGGTTPVVSETTHANVWIARYKTRTRRNAANAVHGIVLVGDVALRLNALGDETVIDEIAAAVEGVAQKLQLLSTLPSLPKNGFCLPSGHVVPMDYGGFNEEAVVQYRLPNGDLLSIETRTNSDNVPDSLSESLKQGALEIQKSVGVEMKITSLTGVWSNVFEGAAAAFGAGSPGRIMVWRTPGRVRAPTAPFIEVSLRTKDSQPASAELMGWIVGSLNNIGSWR